MTPSEFQSQQNMVLQRQAQHARSFVVRNQNHRDKVIKLTQEQYSAFERAMQWPEDIKAYDRLNTPTKLTEIQIGSAA